MKTEISEVSPTRKEIKIEIEAADVRAEFERVTQEYARAVTVPGFRKGHAPVTVVRTRYKKGIEAARRTRPVTDEEIERVVENLREASASLQPVEDRPAQDGDTVTVDIQGRYLDPPEEEDVNASDVDVVLGSEGVLPEFNEGLTGVQPDEVKTF